MAYYEGYETSRAKVEQMDEAGLLKLIDDLYGRDDLPDNYTLDGLRAEALAQHAEEWTERPVPTPEEFWRVVAEVYGRGR
jgi:hypothetical protein